MLTNSRETVAPSAVRSEGATATKFHLFIPEEVSWTLATIGIATDATTEIRILECAPRKKEWPKVWLGYFSDTLSFTKAICRLNPERAKGFYFALNPVADALLARSANRFRSAEKGEGTSDRDITARRWLLVDIDPRRPSGISSSDAEHALSLNRATSIAAHLAGRGWPAPVLADSGNGTHLLYRIDLPTDDGGLVQRVLQSLAARFDDERATVAIARRLGHFGFSRRTCRVSQRSRVVQGATSRRDAGNCQIVGRITLASSMRFYLLKNWPETWFCHLHRALR
jgi:hypothetical protein